MGGSGGIGGAGGQGGNGGNGGIVIINATDPSLFVFVQAASLGGDAGEGGEPGNPGKGGDGGAPGRGGHGGKGYKWTTKELVSRQRPDGTIHTEEQTKRHEGKAGRAGVAGNRGPQGPGGQWGQRGMHGASGNSNKVLFRIIDPQVRTSRGATIKQLGFANPAILAQCFGCFSINIYVRTSGD